MASRALALLVLLGVLGEGAAASAAAPDRPDVLLITVDTLRPDALGWIGGGNETPAIDALAASGFRFPGAVAPAPLTLPSHVSMMTGLTPRGHGVRDNGRIFPATGPQTLAERLRDTGYATAAFVSGFPIAATFGLDRGFDHYDDRLEERATGGELERSAGATVAAALTWLANSSRPRFLWVHFYDPHDPYGGRPVGSFATPTEQRRAYDAEVRAVDAAIGELTRAIGPRQGALTVLAADHGESLGEHGETTHGFFVYQSTIEVPLLFAWPGRVEPGESEAQARLVDLAPTVLDLLGLPAWSDREGISLAPWLHGVGAAMPAAFVESLRPWISYGWAPLDAVIDGRLKLIAAPRPELYDLESDPEERRDRIDSDRPSARRLAALLRNRSTRTAPPATAAGDPETTARLRALGYIGSVSPAESGPPPSGLPDPKDRIELWNRLGRAERRLEEGAAAAALAEFDAVLAVEPRNPFALARSAEALLAAGRPREAEERLRRAIPLAPRQAEIRAALAGLLHRQHRFREAASEWAELVRLRPRDAAAWQSLGAALGLAGQKREAVEAFAKAAELTPASAEAQARLAFAAVGAGDRERAVAALERSAALSPPGGFGHTCSLAILLDDLGRRAESRVRLLACASGNVDFAEARYRLSRHLLEAGDVEGARNALAEAIAADPGIEARARADEGLSTLF